MSKYDFEIDLSKNTSTGLILEKINKGSVVLEFGCATGRMTRYMKESLACKVYIVEYDQSAYEQALEYAEEGLCDDILNFRWFEKFKNIKFDAIIFADVLEHLAVPEKVLENASKLLKDTGCIYASIPNITHNDIVLKAVEERFDYTSTGILDDTHIHFWGLKNLEELSGKYGLNIKQIEGTYCPTGFTEQHTGTSDYEGSLLSNLLRERVCGEIYQFVVTLEKGDSAENICKFRKPSIKSHIYVDSGAGFNAEEIIDFDSEYSGQGSYVAHYVINNLENVKSIRFDPIEYQGCILRNLSVYQGEEKLRVVSQNSIKMEDGLLLMGTDPMVYADVLANDIPVVIDAEIVILGEKYIEMLQNAYVHKSSEFNGLMQSFDNESKKYQKRISDLVVEHKVFNERISNLINESEEVRRDLGAYIILANNKDKYALRLEQELNYLKNIKVLKMYLYTIRILKGVKKRIKRIVGKEACE